MSEPIENNEPAQLNQFKLKHKSSLFVPTTLLFCLPMILLINQISNTLKFPDFYSYVLLLVGGAFFARSYMVSFLTLNEAYLKHKWFLFATNFIFVIVSFWTAYISISDLVINSYPEVWFINMAVANLIFLGQIWINKMYDSNFFQAQLLQIVFLMISVGTLWQKILIDLLGQRVFSSILAVIVALFEVYLVLGVIKLIFNWEKSHTMEAEEQLN
jgi:hypothetical protein